jgi:hypothetical protein
MIFQTLKLRPILKYSILALSIASVVLWFFWQSILDRLSRVDLSKDSAPTVADQYDLDLARRGQYGDSYGSLNALFAGLGLLAVAYTLLLQIEDSAKDDFEEKFFRLLDIWRSYVSGMEFEGTMGATTPKGYNALKRINEHFKEQVLAGPIRVAEEKVSEAQTKVEEAKAYVERTREKVEEANANLSSVLPESEVAFQLIMISQEATALEKSAKDSLERAEREFQEATKFLS